jgi:hypothetical protein
VVPTSGSSVGRMLSLSSLHMSNNTSPFLEARTMEFADSLASRYSSESPRQRKRVVPPTGL